MLPTPSVSLLESPRSLRLILICTALASCGCSTSEPRTSSSTHWLTCEADADCTNLALGAHCGDQSYCMALGGTRLKRTLVLDEAFSGAVLDPSTFVAEATADVNNGEVQAYTDRSENVRVEEGELVITARAEAFDGASFTSGSVQTLNLRAMTFGRFEARLKMPLGRGCSSAFWMMPESPGAPVNSCVDGAACFMGTWPAWGDIVIANHKSAEPGRVVTSVSYGIWDETVAGVDHGVWVGPNFNVTAPDSEWHTFALEWGPEKMEWFVDDSLIASLVLPPPGLYEPEGENPFHRPFYLKLGLAIGGLDQAPVAEDYPQELRVDYLRIWQWLPEE